MRTILAPLDGSPTAAAALPHALGMAARFGAELLLLTVRREESTAVALDLVESTPSEWSRQQWEYLSTMGTRLGAGTRMVSGKPADEILGQAEALQVDLIVMGTHGRRGLDRWVNGSVTDRVTRDAPCPVMVVRAPELDGEQAEAQLAAALKGDFPSYRRLLVPLDGTPAAEGSLVPARRLLAADGGELTLMRVLDFPNPVFSSTEIPSTWAEQARVDLDETHRGYVDAKVTELSAEGLTVTGRYCHGDLAERICQDLHDLVLIGGHSGEGSKIRRVLHRTDSPVLILRGQQRLFGEP